MTDAIKNFIKEHDFIYRTMLFLHGLLGAMCGIKINFDSLREFKAKQDGLVDLGPVNYEFYANIFPRLLGGQKDLNDVTVLDVGANDGWFAKVVFRFCGPNTSMISFEPLRSVIKKLDALATRHPNYRYENVAVGENNGEMEIIEYGTSGLSSIKGLDKEYAYSDHYDVTVVNRYPTEIITIDQYLEKHDIKNDLILKIDTQGFEYEVLVGAKNALASGQVKVVIIELMTLKKYAQAKLYDELLDFLHAYDFKIFDLCKSYYEKDGALSEIDCAFIKR